jgi:hypothetical protein
VWVKTRSKGCFRCASLTQQQGCWQSSGTTRLPTLPQLPWRGRLWAINDLPPSDLGIARERDDDDDPAATNGICQFALRLQTIVVHFADADAVRLP